MRLLDKLQRANNKQKLIITVSMVFATLVLFKYGFIMLPFLLVVLGIPTYILYKIWGDRKEENESLRTFRIGFADIKYTLGSLILLFILIAVIGSIPARWKIQGDLEANKEGVLELFSKWDSFCVNSCGSPAPPFFKNALLVNGATSGENLCSSLCNNLKEIKKDVGFTFIYDRLPYLRRDRYFYYSSMIGCLTGFGGCPPNYIENLVK